MTVCLCRLPDMVGNRTECSMLLLLRKWGISYSELRESNAKRIVRLFGFSSARKMASVLVTHPSGNGYRLYNKGAAEWVLRKSTQVSIMQ